MSNYFEDLVIGETVEIGQTTFTREAIIDFASKYDPQGFHLDDEAASKSLFGALCASGWHTAAVWLRHNIDHRRRMSDIVEFRGERPAKWGPSPGFEKLKWLKPVYVGDTIRYTSRIVDKVPSRSRPTIGLIISENEGHNQKGELVFCVTTKVFAERRVPGPAPEPKPEQKS